MKLPIYLYGNNVLREVAKDITPDYPDFKEFMSDMWETMYFSDGIGLAAPQIGRSIRVFVIDADAMKDDFPECKNFKRVFINAHIIEETGENLTENEGCLSLPNINEKVTRPSTITIEYVNENFEYQKERLSGFAARVVQHEYDHIEGKMFIDHISPLRKTMIKGKLKKIVEGKVRTKYRTVLAKK